MTTARFALDTTAADRRLPGRLLRQHRTPGDGVTAPGRVVLIERGPDDYVTWWQNLQDTGLYHGHYFSDPKAGGRAQADYDARVSRGY